MTDDPLQASLRIAASGLQAQSTRLRVVSENIANAQSTGPTRAPIPTHARPCRSRARWIAPLGANLVEVKAIGVDRTPFKLERDPGNPAADARAW